MIAMSDVLAGWLCIACFHLRTSIKWPSYGAFYCCSAVRLRTYSTLLNMHILSACTHSVSLYQYHVTDQMGSLPLVHNAEHFSMILLFMCTCANVNLRSHDSLSCSGTLEDGCSRQDIGQEPNPFRRLGDAYHHSTVLRYCRDGRPRKGLAPNHKRVRRSSAGAVLFPLRNPHWRSAPRRASALHLHSRLFLL